MAIQELSAVVKPPPKPLETGGRTEWRAIEEQLETGLPRDYREYVLSYGTGLLSGFIVVLHFPKKT